MPRSLLKATIAASAFLALALPAQSVLARTNHALLVAVSDYPNLDEKFALTGPKNDAKLVRNYLTGNSFAPFKAGNIITLADGVEGAKAPTLAAIREGFKALEAKAQPGDFIYLHFSGHGSQAPALNPDEELDGLDELFLPADIGPWNDTVGTVENALVDDEIGRLIDALRAKGATVWAVFDSCHSGTVTRAAPTGTGADAEVSRKLSPDALAIPDDRLVEAAQATTRGTGGPAKPETSALVTAGKGSGQFIAFYAAQTNETTPEMRLPAGKKGRQSHGLFTFTLFETMAQFPGLTYRQLGQEILRRYSTTYRVQPTPLFEGDLDASVFGLEGVEAVRQWQVTQDIGTLTIPAGSIHGLSVGDELLLMNTAADPDDAAAGKLVVSEVSSLSATLESDGLLDIPEFAHARQTTRTLDFEITVARPDTSGLSENYRKLVDGALADLTSQEDTGLRLTFVPPGEPADMRFALPTVETLMGALEGDSAERGTNNALWLLPPNGNLIPAGPEKSLSFNLNDPNAAGLRPRDGEELAAILTDSLTRIARTNNLLKLGGVTAPDALGLSVTLRTRKKKGQPFTDLDPAAIAELVPKDEVHLVAKNETTNPLDLNVLYVGSDYSISFMYNGRIKPGETLKKGLLRINDKSFGRERILLITTQATPQSPVADLSWLAQGALERTRAAGKANAFTGLLRQSGFGTTTRGADLMSDEEDEGGSGAIAQFEIQTRPGS
ncbi:MAG: caspase family protein [Pseudomonadota bacterium]